MLESNDSECTTPKIGRMIIPVMEMPEDDIVLTYPGIRLNQARSGGYIYELRAVRNDSENFTFHCHYMTYRLAGYRGTVSSGNWYFDAYYADTNGY